MRRTSRNFGGFAAGTTVAGLAVGVLEGAYQSVPGMYAALLYGALWAAFGSVVALSFSLAWSREAPPPRRPFLRGVLVALVPSVVVLVRFVVLRDLYAEAPEKALVALGFGLLAGFAVALPVVAVGRAVDRHFALDALGRAWAWAAPVLVLVAFAVTGVGEEEPAASAPSRPTATPHGRGVVLVVADALRPDVLGAYGAGPHRGAPATPQLDAFATGARLFTNASAQASWTRPAVASLFTSRHVSGHDTMAKNAILPETLPTLASVLAEKGVHTGAVVTNYNLEPAYGFARGFADYRYLAPSRYLGAPPEATRLAAYNVYRMARERFVPYAREARFFYQPGSAVSAQGLAVLDHLGDEDFFLYLHYMDSHDPYFAEGGASYARVSTPHPRLALTDAIRDAYRDGVRRFDGAFGELLAGLRTRGLLERTTVIVTSDHGEELGEHSEFFHGTSLYEEVLRLPLLVAGPGIAPGRDARLVRQIDVAPAVLTLFRQPMPVSWEGRDFLAAGPAPAVSVAEEDHEGNRLQSIRIGDDKLILANPDNPRGLAPLELFDLTKDPGERAPLHSPARTTRLEQALGRELAQARQGGAHAAARPADGASEAELRALGYTQ